MNMKRIAALLASTLLLASCVINLGGVTVNGYTEEGCDFSQERPMPMFDEINVAGPFNVYYFQSDESKVLVEGKEEFVQKLSTEVKDGELTVRLEPGRYHNLVLKVSVYSPVADEVRLAGSGDFVDVAGHTSSDDLDYSLAGSGDIIVENVQCKDLDVKLAGSGDIRLKGCVVRKDADISLAGSGNIHLDAEIGDELEARISGSGDMNLNGSCNRADLKISGSGNIGGKLSYRQINTSCSGSGRVSL